MIDVVTFDPAVDASLLAQAEDYRRKIVDTHSSIDNSIIDNYTEDRFKFEEQKAVSLFFLSGEVQGISTLYHRNQFGDAYRCLNRLHFSVDVRTWGRERYCPSYPCNPRKNIVSPLMVEQQAEYLDKGMMFISSEPWKPRWASMIAHNFTAHTSMEWQTDDMLYPVCDQRQEGCWQHLIWTGEGEILSQGITKDDFDARFIRS